MMKKRSIVMIILSVIIFFSLSIFGFVYLWSLDNHIYIILFACLLATIIISSLLVAFSNRKRVGKIRTLEEKIKETNLLSRRLKNSEDIALSYLPVGMILYDDNFTITWANGIAKEFFSNILIDRKLSFIHDNLNNMIQKREGKFLLNIYGKDYEVIHYPKNKCAYLFEVTEREDYKKRLYENTTVIGIVNLDNLDEATANMDLQIKNNIQGKLLGAMDNWCRKYDIYFLNVRPEKSVIYMSKKQLEQVMKDEFSILDAINEISNQNEVRVTVSMGVACFDTQADKLGELAEEALKLALGRGGDQVVVNIQNQPLKMFGGKSNTVEKRTKITARINSRAFSDLISKSEATYIMPHHNTDLDAFGSAIGLLHLAIAQGRRSRIIIDFDRIDHTCAKVIDMLNREDIKLLEYLIDPADAIDEITANSLLVLVDHHSPTQTIEPKLLEKTKNIVIIDHHRRIDNLLSEVSLNYVEPYASSSVELVVEMMELYNYEFEIDGFETTIMLAGMMIDTNNFTYRTGVRTFEAAALLKRYAADPFKARLILRESLDDIKTKSNLVNSAQIIDDRFAIATMAPEDKTDRIQLAKTADELLEIDDIIAAFAIGNIGSETIAISARSIDKFNVSVMMEQFGGGGHLNNAAAQITGGNIPDIIQKLEEILKSSYKEDATMKIILIKDVKGKGKKGEVIEVATGYGNYLLTSKQAIEASNSNIKAIEDEKTKAENDALADLEAMKKLKAEIEDKPIKLYVKIGESGKLFGAINNKQIAEEYKKVYNIDIDKRKILLEDNIHSLGVYKVMVKLHKDVTAVINLQIIEEK
ncbi:MAG: 50S ribosomal protein L9 [Candidatus Izemoplasmatales bacterium]|jgi:ribosomal protein L9|nr:50S ribosomal protein L9 [Candidatus Izemoplasmatales bacterium]